MVRRTARNFPSNFLGIATVLASMTMVGSAWAQQDPADQPKDGGGMHQPEMKRNMNAGFFGAKLGPVTEDAAKDQKMETQDGILIMEMLPDSPAEKAGIEVNDIVTKIDGNAIDGVEDFVKIMEGTKPDQVLKFTLMHEGKEKEVSVTLGKRPPNMGMAPKEPAHKAPPSTEPSKGDGKEGGSK